jgi:hypothetical protein
MSIFWIEIVYLNAGYDGVLANSWQILGKFLANSWQILGKFLANSWQILGKFVDNS